MRCWVTLLVLLVPAALSAAGPKWTYPENPKLDDEIQNVYHSINSIANGTYKSSSMTISGITASSETVTVMTVSTLTVITLNTPAAVSYSPTFSAAWGTVSDTGVTYQIHGNMMHLWGRFTTGTVSAAAGTMSLPSGWVIDPTRATGSVSHFGFCLGFSTGVNEAPITAGRIGFFVYRSASPSTVEFTDVTNTNVWGTRNVSGLFLNSERAYFDLWIPVITG